MCLPQYLAYAFFFGTGFILHFFDALLKFEIFAFNETLSIGVLGVLCVFLSLEIGHLCSKYEVDFTLYANEVRIQYTSNAFLFPQRDRKIAYSEIAKVHFQDNQKRRLVMVDLLTMELATTEKLVFYAYKPLRMNKSPLEGLQLALKKACGH